MVKRNAAYIYCIILAALCLIARLFAYVIQSNLNVNIGLNGYQMLNVGGLGFWCVLLNIFQYIFIILLIALVCVSILEILNDLNVIKFEIICKKITSLWICKICLFVMFLVGLFEILSVWFLILANSEYFLVFGAGTFVLTAICLIGFLLFILLEKKDVFMQKKYNTYIQINNQKNYYD